MLKFFEKSPSRLAATVVLVAMSMPLAGCMGFADLMDEGPEAYTADEMYPIAARKPCGRYIPDLANDPTNHLAANHGCAVHANIAAMVADPRVLTVPRPFGKPTGTAAVMAITNYETNASMSTQTSNGATNASANNP